ncbi:MAG: hypothetical protein ACRDYA_14155 [Egibacteraceae bacterium]
MVVVDLAIGPHLGERRSQADAPDRAVVIDLQALEECLIELAAGLGRARR